MSRRAIFTTVFLGVTAVALIMECWASWDSNPDTVPWTYLIVDHIPGEITAVALGGLMLWLLVHFALRYWHKAQRQRRSGQ